MGVVAGAVLSTFMGVSGFLGGVGSGSVSISYFPTMDNCKDAIMQYVEENQSSEFAWRLYIPQTKETWFARELKSNGNIISMVCKPQG